MSAIRPPFDLESATSKVRAAEDAWNSRDPHRVSLAYSENSVWGSRDQFIHGRVQIRTFLTAKWDKELDYRLAKSLWSFTGNRIAVRFQYEYRDAQGKWFRAYGNELWELGAHLLGSVQCVDDRVDGFTVQVWGIGKLLLGIAAGLLLQRFRFQQLPNLIRRRCREKRRVPFCLPTSCRNHTSGVFRGQL